MDHSEGDVVEVFTYTNENAEGLTDTATLTILIKDTEPVANADTNMVQAGMVTFGGEPAMEAPIINGDVVDGDGSGGVADTLAADGFDGISWLGEAGGEVAGAFGTLTVGADGTYSYDLDDTNATIVPPTPLFMRV